MLLKAFYPVFNKPLINNYHMYIVHCADLIEKMLLKAFYPVFKSLIEKMLLKAFYPVFNKPLINNYHMYIVHVHCADRPIAQLLSARYRCGRSGVRFPGRSNRHSVANDSPPLRRFFGAVLPRRQAAEMGPATRYTLRRNTASIMKI